MPNSGNLSGKYLQATFDRHIRQQGVSGTVYEATNNHDSEGTPLDDTYAKRGTIAALVQETQKARDTATSIGAIGNRAAMGYFASMGKDADGKTVAGSALVKHRRFWKDALGQVWLVHNLPNAQALTATTLGLSVLLTFEEAPPLLGS